MSHNSHSSAYSHKIPQALLSISICKHCPSHIPKNPLVLPNNWHASTEEIVSLKAFNPYSAVGERLNNFLQLCESLLYSLYHPAPIMFRRIVPVNNFMNEKTWKTFNHVSELRCFTFSVSNTQLSVQNKISPSGKRFPHRWISHYTTDLCCQRSAHGWLHLISGSGTKHIAFTLPSKQFLSKPAACHFSPYLLRLYHRLHHLLSPHPRFDLYSGEGKFLMES